MSLIKANFDEAFYFGICATIFSVCFCNNLLYFKLATLKDLKVNTIHSMAKIDRKFVFILVTIR